MSRPLRLIGAVAVIASLWLPWYGIAIPDAVRQAVDAQAGQLPEGFADLARGILASLNEIVTVKAGPWVALAGAAAIALSARAEPTPAPPPPAFPPPAPAETWAPPAATSVPPPR
jgi:hypothetical protein